MYKMQSLLFEILILVFIYIILLTDSIIGSEKNYLDPPRIITNIASENQYSPEKRKFTGIPSIAISPKGRLWSIWYTGITPGEDLNNYVVVATSSDQGQTWEEVLIIDPDGPGPVRAYDPEIWIDPYGKLWIFWAQATALSEGTGSLIKNGTLAGVWTLKIENPETNEIEWNPPNRLTDGVMMCKPIILFGV